MRVEQIGDCTLYLGDCLDVLPTLGNIDAVITDPPYGQDYKVNTFYKNGSRESAVIQRNGKTIQLDCNTYPKMKGDDQPFDPTPLLHLAPVIAMWGAHKFADRLPPGSWLVWDKVPTGKVRDQGDGEACWTNQDKPMRIFRLLWDGLCVGKGARHECTAGQKRYHPTQKPEILMRWTMDMVRAQGVICDPYMGSGSTGVACVQTGRSFIGIEDELFHFDNACKRIEVAVKNESSRLPGFKVDKKKVEQTRLFA